MAPETLASCEIDMLFPGDLVKKIGYNLPAYNESQCAFATCSKPGVFKFFVHRNNDLATKDVFYITISDGQKYHWYMTVLDGGSDPVSTNGSRSLVKNNAPSGHRIKIWIIDYSLADFDELNGLATYPSKSSRQITYGLYEMGEAPSITLTKAMNLPLQVDTSNITFVTAER